MLRIGLVGCGNWSKTIIEEIKNNHNFLLKSVVCRNGIKTNFGNDFLTVTPGIRMQQSDDDQKRSGSLFDAIQFGSDFVVVGRELTQAKNKTDVINQFNSLMD